MWALNTKYISQKEKIGKISMRQREWDRCEDLYKANNPWKQFKMQLKDLVDDTEDDLSYENAIKEQFKQKK